MSDSKSLKGIRYAKAIHRISSFFLDQIIIGVLIGIIAGFYGFLSTNHSAFEENYLAYFFVSIIYYSLYLSSNWQATPGMKAIGIYITTTDFEKIHITQSIIRYILFCFNIIFVGFLSAFFGKVLIEIFQCNNFYEIDLNILLAKNNEISSLNEDIILVSKRTLTYVFGAIFAFKMLLLYIPISITAKKQTAYDYISQFVVIKKDTIAKK